MAEENKVELEEIRKQIFDKIAANDKCGLKLLLAQVKGGVNFVDENGMSPLEHACCKGDKESVQTLLDMVCYI